MPKVCHDAQYHDAQCYDAQCPVGAMFGVEELGCEPRSFIPQRFTLAIRNR